MLQTVFLAFIGTFGLLVETASAYPNPPFSIVPAPISNLTSQVQFQSSSFGLDSPHVKSVNATTWDWWYFDVVSPDQKTSVVIVFYTAPATGFVFNKAPANDILLASLNVAIPGSPEFFSGGAFAEEAIIVSQGNGASGDWRGTGFEFVGAPDLSSYTILVDSPKLGLKGEVTLKSVAPAHYACSLAKAGQSMEVMPHVGWANAIPGAVAQVDLDVNGTKVNFKGVGYHDKNWGDQSFVKSVGSWYWGHGQLGPYTIVWFDALQPNGSETQSAYVALNGQVLTSSCSGITVRPTGANSTYPPHVNAGPPAGFHIEIDLHHQQKLIVDVKSDVLILDGAELYFRWTGKLTGGIKGGPSLTGTALFEQFALSK